jgi:ankyrin repeat protein
MTHEQAVEKISAAKLQGPAHGNLTRVREILDSNGSLVDAMNSIDANQVDETPQGAAAHTQSHEILKLMLDRGVRTDIFMAAALGRADEVEEFLRANPSLAGARGAHQIPLIAHATDKATAEAMIRHGVACDIFMATQLGLESHVAKLLDEKPQLLNAHTPQGLSVLKTAVMFRHKPLVKMLLERGAEDPGDAARHFLNGSSMEAQNEPGMLFDNLDLRGAVVHNVNLGHVVLENVNLAGAVFMNVNLKDAIIDFATLEGLKICGVEIWPAIESELKRREENK